MVLHLTSIKPKILIMKKYILLLLSVVTFTACLNDDGPEYSYEILEVKEATVPDSFTFGEDGEITITYDLPSACYSFHSLYYEYQDTARIVAVNALKREINSCSEALIEKEHTFLVNVTQQEDYVFKFWKGTDADGNNIFEEKVVPVN